MKKENMDLWMKSSLEGYSSPIPVGGWKGLHQSRRKKKRKFLIWFSAACLIVFAGLGVLKFGNLEPREQVQEVHKQPALPSTSETKPAEIQQPSEDKITQLAPATRKKERNNALHEEVHELPKLALQSLTIPVSQEIESRSLAPFNYSPTALLAHPIKEEIQPRFGKRISFYLESGLAIGNLSFAKDASPALYRSDYSTFLKKQDLRHLERSFGFMAYYQGLRRWSLGTGLSLSHHTAHGKVDYSYFESGLNLVTVGEQFWPANTIDQTASLSHETTLRSWNISVPVRFRYQPFAFWGPYLEIGASYTYRISNQGDWLNPETLSVERSRNLVPKHLFSTELSVGYQVKLHKTSLSLNYCFSPWSDKYAPIQGRMGTNLHGLRIQVQMPH